MGSRRSLRQELVLWYSLVLLVALSAFAGISYLLLRQTLARAGTASLRQTALAAEQLLIPPGVPRVAVREERVPVREGDVEAIRRRTRLASGDLVDIYVTRSGDVEERALRSFALIALGLIPLTALAAALGGRTLADRLLRPLNRLVGATREIGIGGLSRRVEEPERPAELRELAYAFNGMLARLDAAVGELRRFTSDASHELRTPLTAIRGTVQVALSRERSAAELRHTLADVAEETEWMLHLVEGLLTLARGEQDQSRLARTPIDLMPLLAEVVEIGEALAAERAIAIRLEGPQELVVTGNASALRQVFLNLVSNAVKFTDHGEIAIRARTGAGDEPATIEVADSGRGIPPDEQERVFERFFRGDTARGRGGSGLGLAIARSIVEAHGGSISVRSEPGRGSTFRVTLPERE